jgi:hypothetical protein
LQQEHARSTKIRPVAVVRPCLHRSTRLGTQRGGIAFVLHPANRAVQRLRGAGFLVCHAYAFRVGAGRLGIDRAPGKGRGASRLVAPQGNVRRTAPAASLLQPRRPPRTLYCGGTARAHADDGPPRRVLLLCRPPPGETSGPCGGHTVRPTRLGPSTPPGRGGSFRPGLTSTCRGAAGHSDRKSPRGRPLAPRRNAGHRSPHPFAGRAL